MLPLNSFEEFESHIKLDKQLSKADFSLRELSELCIESGFKIMPTIMRLPRRQQYGKGFKTIFSTL